MQVGDKVLVTYSDDDQRVGRIVGETPKMWKIEFDGDDKETRVTKTKNIVLIDDPVTPEPEVITIDTRSVLAKFLDWLKSLFTKKIDRDYCSESES